ncbi:MAG: UPF0262 family protein [Alphaproteobacteria bacterium]|nr:UPF0262 family protein [Alphaproteobacteria bacterium]
MPKPKPRRSSRITAITLDEHLVVRFGGQVAEERAAAIRDILAENEFRLAAGPAGPYSVHLAVADNRLRFQVKPRRSKRQIEVTLAMQPFRGIVRDYFTICESYYAAIQQASLTQIQAIDMGRRGVHDEGATLLHGRLADRVTMDHATARRLFTLVCVLHIRA